jgi:membrane fusion protein, multidrug efflux system
MNRVRVLSGIACVVLFAACSKQASAPPPAAPEVLTVKVAHRDVPIVREWIGTLQGDVDAEIRPKVQGYLLRRAYSEGSVVAKGQTLFEIDPRQFQAKYDQSAGTVGRAKAYLAKTNVDVERYTPLAAQKAVSQQELDNALAARDEATAALASAEAALAESRLNLEWTRVASPIAGVAGIAQAQVGNLVDGAVVLATVSSIDPIRVQFSISEQEYMSVAARLNQAVEARPEDGTKLELVLTDGTVYPHKGYGSALGRQVDVKTGTIALIGKFPNPGNILRPGQFARVRAVIEMRKDAIVAPQRAVSELQGSFLVGVVKADGTAEIRPVTVGPRIGNEWVIDKGLEAGDEVIVEGLQFVRTGSKVVAKPAPADGNEQHPEAH